MRRQSTRNGKAGPAAAILAAALAACSLATSGRATAHTGHDANALGTVNFPVSCSAAAQKDFDRGLALLHHMTYPQAQTSFVQAAATDPRCAMAHWGVAMTLFQPLWPTRP